MPGVVATSVPAAARGDIRTMVLPAGEYRQRTRHARADTGTVRLELTRRGDYAVRAMIALAGAPATEWVSVPRIATEMSIPERFLPRVMRDLWKADLVQARTGRSGGYRLATPATQLTLLDVIDAVEPPHDDRRCVLRGIPCGLDGRCVVHEAFADAREAQRDRLAATTLAMLVSAPRSGPPGP